MRSFKALWRLAVNRREDRPGSHAGDKSSAPGPEPTIRDRNEKTVALLILEPPTRILQ